MIQTRNFTGATDNSMRAHVSVRIKPKLKPNNEFPLNTVGNDENCAINSGVQEWQAVRFKKRR